MEGRSRFSILLPPHRQIVSNTGQELYPLRHSSSFGGGFATCSLEALGHCRYCKDEEDDFLRQPELIQGD